MEGGRLKQVEDKVLENRQVKREKLKRADRGRDVKKKRRNKAVGHRKRFEKIKRKSASSRKTGRICREGKLPRPKTDTRGKKITSDTFACQCISGS